MGGKNHQPCRQYLAISTQVSRHASMAFAELELANVALEDLLLAEINGKIGDISSIEQQLGNSRRSITQLINTISELEAEMDRLNFRDLSTIHPVNLDVIGSALIGAGMVHANAWDEVVKNALSGGFRKNLAMIHSHALLLAEHTDKLAEQVIALQQQARDGNVTRVLEENLHGNLKPVFAKLYSAWVRFQELFLASALLSTEVYYAFNNYGSLVDVSTQTATA